MGVFVPTGYNENYMYLQQSAQTLPNGLVSAKNVGGWGQLKLSNGQAKSPMAPHQFGTELLV